MTEPNVPANPSETPESDSALRVSPPVKKKRKWLKATLIALALVIVLGVPLAYVYICASIRSSYGFAIYANAIRAYQESHRELPPAIETLEEAYDQYEGRHFEFREIQNLRRPYYRPPPPGCQGPFLVVVERVPEHWSQRGARWVIYVVRGDGPYAENWVTDLKTVRASELADLILQDDALRQECRPDTP
jgi:hypothetical protein